MGATNQDVQQRNAIARANNGASSFFEDCDFSIAFDIDGVLQRGKEVLAHSKEVIELLHSLNVPFILLTNGGGKTERAHAERVSERLGVTIEEDQFIQSHTPFKSLVAAHKGHFVLVLGGHEDQIRDLAVAYGFDHDSILTDSDLLLHFPHLAAFAEISESYHAKFGRFNPKFAQDPAIHGVFVFSSPRDWYLDLQICVDLLLSKQGRLGTRSSKNGNTSLEFNGFYKDGQPMIHFCNPDVQWATSHPQPRLAQGAFMAALEGIWRDVTKGQAPFNIWSCGKPTARTYQFAETAIQARHRKQYPGSQTVVRRAYMIGDNPESDVRGAYLANQHHACQIAWSSVLVETGVYQPRALEMLDPAPTAIRRNV
ncbi:HAD-like domain-containing protein [Coniella lustricola]|uniref:HAD-like domain-containing protein n=1 Tax=Coniella lustricola TaxID=2025994 RepID=A0A2T2ZTL5_9PEZI|nr:HAD-like domain-containing protein [Coniella lustricola]